MKFKKHYILYLLLILSFIFFLKNKDGLDFSFMFEDGISFKQINNDYSTDLTIVNIPTFKQENFYYSNNVFSKQYTQLKESKTKKVLFTSSFRMVYLVLIHGKVYETNYFLDTIGINHKASFSKIITPIKNIIDKESLKKFHVNYKSNTATAIIILILSIFTFVYTYKTTNMSKLLAVVLCIVYFIALLNIIVDIRYLFALKNVIECL